MGRSLSSLLSLLPLASRLGLTLLANTSCSSAAMPVADEVTDLGTRAGGGTFEIRLRIELTTTRRRAELKCRPRLE